MQLVVWRAAFRDFVPGRCSLHSGARTRSVQASGGWASPTDAALPSQCVRLIVPYSIKGYVSALLMHQCWHGDPRERPIFPDIVTRIDHRLRQIAASNYDYIDAVSDYYVSFLLHSSTFKTTYSPTPCSTWRMIDLKLANSLLYARNFNSHLTKGLIGYFTPACTSALSAKMLLYRCNVRPDHISASEIVSRGVIVIKYNQIPYRITTELPLAERAVKVDTNSNIICLKFVRGDNLTQQENDLLTLMTLSKRQLIRAA